MLLFRIDESEITGDLLNRYVPRPGNRRMGGRHLPNSRQDGAQPEMTIPLGKPRRGASIEPV